MAKVGENVKKKNKKREGKRIQKEKKRDWNRKWKEIQFRWVGHAAAPSEIDQTIST